MKNRFPIDWEEIESNLQRAKVRGGWLVKTFEDVTHRDEAGAQDGWDWRVAMTFVPDPNHEWEFE